MSFLSSPAVRVAGVSVGLAGAFFMPPWVPIAAMVLIAARYPAWEVLLIGLVVDLMWFSPSAGLFGPVPLFTILGLVLLWAFEPLRREFI